MNKKEFNSNSNSNYTNMNSKNNSWNLNNDYTLITRDEFNKLIPGGYVKYFDRHNKFHTGGILIKCNNPVLVLKSYRSNRKWYVNILENEIYYKKNAAPGYNKMFTHLLNGLEKNTIFIN